MKLILTSSVLLLCLSNMLHAQKLHTTSNSSCPNILLKDGTQIKAFVLEVDNKIVKYASCEDHSQIKTHKSSDIVQIDYGKGGYKLKRYLGAWRLRKK